MNTKKALSILSKGDKVYEDRSTSMLNSDKFLDMYNERERAIMEKKSADSVPLPFLESIRRKVSKMVESPNESLPIVTRFDLYTGIRKLSERAPSDAGLKRLASQLERAWHTEPMGALSYGDVNGLVKLYRDQHPRSKAADAIEAECSRVGMHKLPVAKLARIASNITSQEDYDMAMESNGFAGDRAEQVRARSLVRELVALRGAGVDANLPEAQDERTIDERISDRFAREAAIEKNAGYAEAEQMLASASDMAAQMAQLVDNAARDLFSDGIDIAGQTAQALSRSLEQWHGQLTDLRDNAATPSEEQVDAMQPKPPAAPAAPADPELQEDMAGAQMKKKWYDPRTWSLQGRQASARIASQAAAAASYFEGEIGTELFKFAQFMRQIETRMAQLAPPDELDMPPKSPLEMEMEMDAPLDMPGDMPGDMPADAPGNGEVGEQELAQGVDIVQDIQEMATEIVDEAPPEAMDYLQHEMDEGHTAPVGTPTWGAEEVLNEGHEFAPPSEEWLQEELEELMADDGGMGDEMGPPGLDAPDMGPPAVGAGEHDAQGIGNDSVVPGGMSQNHTAYRCPECGMLTGKGHGNACSKKQQPTRNIDTPGFDGGTYQAAKGKGIPLPDSKIKQQPNDKSLVEVPEDGGKALKASEIEEAILDGKTVQSKSGAIKIRLNENDCVELWDRTAGRECDLYDLDIAIADFINMANHEVKVAAAHKRATATVNVVDVPCDICATISQFQIAASVKDSYGCECGNLISAGLIHSLVKLGQLQVRKVAQMAAPDYDGMAQEIVNSGSAYDRRDMVHAVMDMHEANPTFDPDELMEHVDAMAKVHKTNNPLPNVAPPQAPMAPLAPKAPKAPNAPMSAPTAGRKAQDAMPAPGGPPVAAPPPAAPAPAAPAAAPAGEEENPVTDMPVDEVIKGAFVNYKAQGMKLQEALRTFMKEHGDLMESPKWTPDADAIFVAMQTQYYTSAPAATPAAAPAMPMAAQKVLEPAIKKHDKDHVSVGAKPLGKDSQGEDLLPSPGRIKQQQGKPQGNFSSTDMGTDTSSDEWSEPGTAKSSPNKGKLPNKNLGTDTEGNDPFKTPALGK